MDIVDFAEKICNFPLSDWQKEFLYKSYEAVKNEEEMNILVKESNRIQCKNNSSETTLN